MNSCEFTNLKENEFRICSSFEIVEKCEKYEKKKTKKKAMNWKKIFK